MDVVVPLAHAGHWAFALPPITVVAGLAFLAVVERRRGRREERGER
jgi:hypothetical protein